MVETVKYMIEEVRPEYLDTEEGRQVLRLVNKELEERSRWFFQEREEILEKRKI